MLPYLIGYLLVNTAYTCADQTNKKSVKSRRQREKLRKSRI